MAFKFIDPKSLLEIGVLKELIIEELRKELEDQGHNMTGALSKSIRINTEIKRGNISLIGSFLRYGAAVDQGVKADKVPFNPGSGKKTSKYISGLIRFVKLRRIATKDKEARRIAFAIAHKHKREGIPTKDSSRFSKNGRRLGWISRTLDENTEAITEILTDIFENEIGVNFDNLLKNIE